MTAEAPRAGRHHLHIPGPAPIPDAVSRAMARPLIDHRGPEFARLTRSILERLGPVFGCAGPIAVYPSSGTGAWEAALVNTLSPGDQVLCCDNGHFARLWGEVARRLGLAVERLGCDWRDPVDPRRLRDCLAADAAGRIRAVLALHNETSTGTLSDVAALRGAMDDAGHEALLLVDAVSSLAAADYRHDEWRVDVTVAGSQKGLMLPPGLGFNAIGEKALAASKKAGLPRSYWDWGPLLEAEERGFFPYTPAVSLLFGLDAALGLLEAEGLPAVQARHRRLAGAAHAAVDGWGLELFCAPGGSPLAHPDRRPGAGGLRRRRAAAGDPRTLRPVPGHGAGPAGGAPLPHRPSRVGERPAAGRGPVRRGDGPLPGRGSAPGRRRPLGSGAPGRRMTPPSTRNPAAAGAAPVTRVAVIGLGGMGGHHADAVREEPGCELVGGAEIDAERARAWG